MQKKTYSILLLLTLVLAPLAIAKSEAYFSPGKAAEDGVVEFIQGTKKTAVIAIYSLTNPRIGDTIKTVGKTKKVRVICDKQQAQIKSALCADVGGRIDKKSGLMHNKFIVRDNECVLTGSFNFTKNATRSNRENYVIICDKKLAKQYSQEFEKLWKNNT